MAQSNFFIVTGAEGAGKTKVLSELEKIFPFYWVNYVSNRDTVEKGTQKISYDEYQKLAEADSFILSFRKRDSMVGVTYDEIRKARASGKTIIWEVDLKWLETIKNEYPEARVILVNGLNAEDLYEHFESKGHAVPAAMAIQAARSNRLNKWWHEWVDFIAENKKDAADKAAAAVKNIIEGKVEHAPA